MFIWFIIFLLQVVEFLDYTGKIETEPVKLLVIGYIRKLQITDDILQALSVTDEDRSIARDALDLQTFSEYAHDIHFSWVVTVSLLARTPLPQVWHCYCWLTSMMTATFSSRKLHEIRVTRRKGKKYREKKTWFDVTICCNNGLVSMSYKKYHCICTWAEW